MASQQAAPDSEAPRPANDGNRDPHGKQPGGLANQNVTRPAPPPTGADNAADAGSASNASGERNRQQERGGLENSNVTRPDPVR